MSATLPLSRMVSRDTIATARTGPPMVEVSHLTKRFGDFVAVDDVSFDVAAGEVFGLLGPNGAGKTTVIRMVITLIPPTSGTARVAGLAVGRDDARIRAVLGYVPQALSADGMLTGYENLLIIAELVALPRAERTRRVQEVLRQMELEPFADRMVRDYSGGMIRRLRSARPSCTARACSSSTSPPWGSTPPPATRSGRPSRRCATRPA